MIKFNKEQVYIVTGASSGIGEATALLLNELGATVVAIARREDKLNEAKQKSKHPENFFVEPKDLAEDINNLPTYIKTLKEKYGKFSGMAYCAGIPCLNPLKILDYDMIKSTFDIDYFAPVLMLKGLTDRRNNVGNGCSIVMVSSIDAVKAAKGQCIYGGAKAALSNTTKAISREITPAGLRINSVLPSMIRTPLTQCMDSLLPELENDPAYPFGWGEPEDVANAIIFLLSDKSRFISGQNFIIDSGGVI